MKDKKRGVFYHKNGHIDLVKTFHGDNPSLSKNGIIQNYSIERETNNKSYGRIKI